MSNPKQNDDEGTLALPLFPPVRPPIVAGGVRTPADVMRADLAEVLQTMRDVLNGIEAAVAQLNPAPAGAMPTMHDHLNGRAAGLPALAAGAPPLLSDRFANLETQMMVSNANIAHLVVESSENHNRINGLHNQRVFSGMLGVQVTLRPPRRSQPAHTVGGVLQPVAYPLPAGFPAAGLTVAAFEALTIAELVTIVQFYRGAEFVSTRTIGDRRCATC